MGERPGLWERAGGRLTPSLPSRILPLHLPLLVCLLSLCPLSHAVQLKAASSNGRCELGWLACGDNATWCIEQRFICNQMIECPNGEDEAGCVDNKGDSSFTKEILQKIKLSDEKRMTCNLTRYPDYCLCRLGDRLHCKNANLTSVPQYIDQRVTALLLGNNSIVLSSDSFQRYPNISMIHLQYNGITSLPEGVFYSLTHLGRVFLRHNKLSTDTPKTLAGLKDLKLEEPALLDLSHNNIRHLDLILDLVPGINTLWLNYNKVDLRDRQVSLRAPLVRELFLEHNLVEELTPESLKGFTGLESLYLRHNRIRVIEAGAFNEMSELIDLELNFNWIQHLFSASFVGLVSLRKLNLEGNPLLTSPVTTFSQLPSLKSLVLERVELSSDFLSNISTDLTQGPAAANMQHVYFKRFRYCGYVLHVKDCRPKTDGVSSFQHLLVGRELRVAVWLVALTTLVGNLTVLAGRVFSRDDNKILSLFIRNLAVADLLTGLYLMVVAVKDVQFRSEYSQHAYYWMGSWQCTLTGILAMTSAEVSVLLLSFMSVERWLCITWPLGAPKLSLGGTKVALVCIWATGITLAITPVVYYHSRQGFYGTNGLCFPLHLDDPWVPGWLYSALIFVGINQIGVVVILMSYMGMFCSIRRTRANTPLSLGDREFTMRFFFIVFTDCLCWTPIIIVRIMALAEIDIKPDLYAYVVVVLLPINSALNPFLYTFTTTKFRSHLRRFLRGKGVCIWSPRTYSDSEVTRTSFLRSATSRLSNGRDFHPHYNGANHTVDESTVAEVSRMSIAKDDLNQAETKL